LGEIVTEKIKGRATQEDVTVFKSVGMAVQDLVTADLTLRLAEKSGIGKKITL
jgi:ornithine cyclodeaminase/alanine dehydrogenase-like protein (mu-crystallin family)